MTARLYAGTVLLVTAAIIRAAWAGDWSVVLIALLGVLLVIASFAEEGGSHDRPR